MTAGGLAVGRGGPTSGLGRAATRPTGPRCDVCRSGRATTVCLRCHRPLCWEHDGLLVPPEAASLKLQLRRTLGRPTTSTAPGSAARPSDGRAPAPRSRPTTSPAGRTPTSSFATVPVPAHPRAQGQVERESDPFELLAEKDWRDHTHDPSPGERHLCPTCLPVDRRWAPEMVGSAVTAVLGVVALLSGTLGTTAPDPVLLVVGAVLVLVGVGRRVLCRRRAREAGLAARALDLPVVSDPHLTSVRHEERAEADIRLFADRTYERTVRDPRGVVTLEASWTGRGGGRATRPDAGPGPAGVLRAGHVVLCGPADVTITEQRGIEVEPDRPMIASLAPHPEDHPVLGAFGEGHDARWRLALPYEIGSRGRVALSRIRVDVLPTLVPGSGRHGLDLDVTWRTAASPAQRFRTGPVLVGLDLVRLEIPARWGRVEARGDRGGSGDEPDVEVSESTGRRTVTWRDPDVGLPSARRTRRFSLRFANEINTDDEITGRVEARFRGAVSGTTGTLLLGGGGAPRAEFRPDRTGTRRHEAGRHASVTTVVVTDLHLALGGLTYQEIRSVPDRLRDDDYGPDNRFPGVTPGHDTVAHLADELGAAQYYVKRVIENTPQVGRAGALSRSWDIGGRRYNGVYPVDFDIAITGEEPASGEESAGAWLVAKLDVSGAFATPEMRDRVGRERDHLWAVIRRALRGDPDGPLAPAAGPDRDRAVRLAEVLALLEEARREAWIAPTDHERITADLAEAFGPDPSGPPDPPEPEESA